MAFVLADVEEQLANIVAEAQAIQKFIATGKRANDFFNDPKVDEPTTIDQKSAAIAAVLVDIEALQTPLDAAIVAADGPTV